MSTILIIILLILIFGGGGGYYAHARYGTTGLGGVLGIVFIVLIVLWLVGEIGEFRIREGGGADASERCWQIPITLVDELATRPENRPTPSPDFSDRGGMLIISRVISPRRSRSS